MKRIAVLGLILFITSCTAKRSRVFTETIVEDTYVNDEFLQHIKQPEKALLSWYLYAYGNACESDSQKAKCRILNAMDVSNECEDSHRNMLLKWFKTDKMVVFKLKKCPGLSADSAIQNTIDKIILKRSNDTISVQYSINGLNTVQEKSWNVNKTDSYVIRNGTLTKI